MSLYYFIVLLLYIIYINIYSDEIYIPSRSSDIMPNIELAYSVAFILSSRKEMEHDKYQIGYFSVADISYVSYGLRLFIY